MQLISHKLPPAAYFYYEATGHMSQIGRAIEVVKTGQEIAAKFEKRHLQPQTSLFDMLCAAAMSTRLCDFIKASGCCHWDAEWDWWKEEERGKVGTQGDKNKVKVIHRWYAYMTKKVQTWPLATMADHFYFNACIKGCILLGFNNIC